MSAPAIVTIVLAAVAALTVVAFLIAIALVLKGVNARLVAVIRAVMTIVDKTEPVGPVVMSIDRNLGAAREVLESLLKRKLGAVPAPARSEPATRAAPACAGAHARAFGARYAFGARARARPGRACPDAAGARYACPHDAGLRDPRDPRDAGVRGAARRRWRPCSRDARDREDARRG